MACPPPLPDSTFRRVSRWMEQAICSSPTAAGTGAGTGIPAVASVALDGAGNLFIAGNRT